MASTLTPSGTPPSARCHTRQCHARPPSSTSSSGRQTSDRRKRPLPLATTRLFRPHPSSTSVAPSTAEGKATPVDDAAAKHGTLALRAINSHYPSRRRCARPTGAQSSAYSEPVVVRTYYAPASGRRQRPSGRGGAGSRTCGPAIGVGAAGGVLGTMARAYTRKRSASGVRPDIQLPPVEAFRFKSFLANADINADLDRIAEICARASYSLSNQYEVHCAPHGPGASFLASGHGHNRDPQGPTVQAVAVDDEQLTLSIIKRRRRVGRGNIRAVGTLETIMSSSRSSDEEIANKTSASAPADGVRGRAARKTQASRPSSPKLPSVAARDASDSQDDHSPQQQQQKQQQQQQPPPPPSPGPLPRRSSTPLALMDNSRQGGAPWAASRPRASSWALVGEPASPRASGRQLETRTASADPSIKPKAPRARASSAPRAGVTDAHPARGCVSSTRQDTLGKTTGSSISGWLPSMSTSIRPKPRGRAESSLRDLLHNTEHKARGTGSAVK
ncbi:hypothetical protein E4U42_004755 [Claviceps africana]|uniref:Uncharacterized protein n=1 Tax=Claviceps africana TaxID=83212 RepID=A0A8K0J570_9HYPO|nr:hypothetical protein E4U42_004755 [Claviceps africana]